MIIERGEERKGKTKRKQERDESVFTRFERKSSTSGRSRDVTHRSHQSIGSLISVNQALSQTAQRDRESSPKEDTGMSSQEDGTTAIALTTATGSPSRCNLRRACEAVESGNRSASEHLNDESCHRAFELDPQKKKRSRHVREKKKSAKNGERRQKSWMGRNCDL
jgi:hypothetical protein